MKLKFTKMHGAGNDFIVPPTNGVSWLTAGSASEPTRFW